MSDKLTPQAQWINDGTPEHLGPGELRDGAYIEYFSVDALTDTSCGEILKTAMEKGHIPRRGAGHKENVSGRIEFYATDYCMKIIGDGTMLVALVWRPIVEVLECSDG